LLILQFRATVTTHDPIAAVTWKDVEPILRARCFSCHMADGPALPSLSTYEEFKVHQAEVKAAVLTRRMPIWSAVRGFGAFQRDPSLSARQISLIASWIEGGAQRGTVPPGATSEPSRASNSERRSSSLRLEVAVPPVISPEGVQRETVVIPGSGTITVVGWRVVFADPTIAVVRFTNRAGRLLWTAMPGFEDERFPPGVGIRLTPPLELIIDAVRRTRDADGRLRPPKRVPSQLEIDVSKEEHAELRSVSIACGTDARVSGTIYALRPSVMSRGSIEVRTISNEPRVLGGFTDPRAEFPLTYWLRQPESTRTETTVAAVGPSCSVEVISAQERPGSIQP
jgi:hypothetical protein